MQHGDEARSLLCLAARSCDAGSRDVDAEHLARRVPIPSCGKIGHTDAPPVAHLPSFPPFRECQLGRRHEGATAPRTRELRNVGNPNPPETWCAAAHEGRLSSVPLMDGVIPSPKISIPRRRPVFGASRAWVGRPSGAMLRASER